MGKESVGKMKIEKYNGIIFALFIISLLSAIVAQLGKNSDRIAVAMLWVSIITVTIMAFILVLISMMPVVEKYSKKHQRWENAKRKIGDIKAEYDSAQRNPMAIVEMPLLLEANYKHMIVFRYMMSQAMREINKGAKYVEKAEKIIPQLADAWNLLYQESSKDSLLFLDCENKEQARCLMDAILSDNNAYAERIMAWQRLTIILDESGISKRAQHEALILGLRQQLAPLIHHNCNWPIGRAIMVGDQNVDK
jgi:hypothetical protein